MEPVRAFVAIELSQGIKTVLARLQSGLRSESYVKWVDSESIHLTLKFLGNVASDRVPQVVQAMARASAGVPFFELRIEQLGAFPSINSPRVVWVGVGGEVERCATLKRRLDDEFTPLGFSVEDREFSPHLTLGRVREKASVGERRRLGELISSLKAGSEPVFSVGSVSLMRSQLTPAGAIYSCLSSVKLEKV